MKSIDGLDALESAHRCDVMPQSIFDEAEEGRKVGSVGVVKVAPVEAGWNTGNVKFLAGLVLGVLLPIFCARLVRALGHENVFLL